MPEPPPHSRLTISEHAETWLDEIENRERKSYSRRAASYTRNVILPIVGKSTLLAQIKTRTVRDLQEKVLRRTLNHTDRETGEIVERPIRTKTARNIITTYFRR